MAKYVLLLTYFLRNCGWAWHFMEYGGLEIAHRENIISSRNTTRKDLRELDSQSNED